MLTWDAIYREAAHAAGVEPRIVHIASDWLAARHPPFAGTLLGDKAHSAVFDNTKIKRAVPGFTCRVPWADGVRRSLAWFEADAIPPDGRRCPQPGARRPHHEVRRIEPEAIGSDDRLVYRRSRPADLTRLPCGSSRADVCPPGRAAIRDRIDPIMPTRLRLLRSCLSLVLVAGALAGPAGAAQPGTGDVPLLPAVREGELPNGLRYFIRANQRPEGRAELRLVVNAGSILEDDDQLGAAHFIEHMSFNGTRRFPKNELVSYLQSVGVRLGGDLNANTGYDETIYILPIPTGDRPVFENGLAILREWAGNASLNEADIDSERNVVLAELRSGQAAEERVRRQTLPRMFNGSRYATRLPIGTERSLRTMTADALRRFYRDWYRPDLEAVIVVGDINADQVEQSIKTLFSDLKGPDRPRTRPKRFEIPPRTTLDSLVVADAELPSGRIDITEYVRPQPSLASIAAYDALLKDQLVNRMFGMRLYELTDQPIRPFLAAQAVRSPIVRGYEAFVASAAIAGQDPVETTRLLATEIERARRFGFTTEELDAAKREVLNNYAQAAAEGDKSESASLGGRARTPFPHGRTGARDRVGVRPRETGRARSDARDHQRARADGALRAGQRALRHARRTDGGRRHRRRARRCVDERAPGLNHTLPRHQGGNRAARSRARAGTPHGRDNRHGARDDDPHV